MMNNKYILSSSLILAISLGGISGCSTLGKVGKSARNMTKLGSQSRNNEPVVNEKLIIPPSLKKPATAQADRQAPMKSAPVNRKNYYIVVGTYPDQGQALDTFVRLSSIGLPGATMESRKTKSGKVLHMVRLGPYQKQEQIDKVKDSLTNDGLSQFKVVEN